MAYLVLKHGKWYARVKGHKQPGKWSTVGTGYPEVQRAEAQECADAMQAEIDARDTPANLMTFARWFGIWIDRRKAEGVDWKKDLGRIRKHVLPVLGHRELASVTTSDVAQLVHKLRFGENALAPRTVRNVYSALSALMRDAAIDQHIAMSPCVLKKKQLGSVIDKNPEWRSGALFTHQEAEALISDDRIPLDRRVVYGFGLLAGMRLGEAAALRWRHYEPGNLGRLSVALSYSTSYSKTKRTKTETTKAIPVHPALAALLELWRKEWPAMFGHEPTAEDLIVPLPPNVKRRTRTGERFRGWDYTGRMWRTVDLPMLGWRSRSVYDTRATFITLAVDGGASRDIIRDRVTHTKAQKTAFDGYDRGTHWTETCREVAKLSVSLRVTAVSPIDTLRANNKDAAELQPDESSGGGFRMPDERTLSNSLISVSDGERPILRTSCDEGFEVWAHARVTASKDDE